MPDDDTGFVRGRFREDAFIHIDSEGRILQSDECLPMIFGIPNAALTGKNLWDLLSPDLRARLRDVVQQSRSKQVCSPIESYNAHLGVWLEYHVRSITDGIILFILNITARQRPTTVNADTASDREEELKAQVRKELAEKEELCKTQEKFKMALAAAHMSTWEYDVISGTFSLADNFQDITGLRHSSVQTPQDIPSLLPPDDYKVNRERLEAAVNEGTEYVSEFRLRNPDTGEIRWFESRGRVEKDEQATPLRIYGIVADITPKKWIQEELERRVAERTQQLNAANQILRESEARFRMALLNAPISMAVLDKNFCIKWMHHPLIPDDQEYIGKKIDSILPSDEADEVMAMANRVVETGTRAKKEMWITVSGRETCCEIMMEPIPDDGDGTEGITALALDITERKRAEDDLRALNAALEDRADQLRKFSVELSKTEERERRRIAAVLHDNLQQLLVGAKLAMDLLSMYRLDEKVNPGVSKAQKLINESIAVTRSLTAELAPSVLYQEGLQQALLWLADWVAEKYGLNLVLEVDKHLQEPDQEAKVVLFQAVRELLFNIAKHAQVSQAYLSLFTEEQWIHVTVRDEGVGFDSNKLRSGSPNGGFGLMATAERIAAIGGDLEIKSAPGRGTTSTIRIPNSTH